MPVTLKDVAEQAGVSCSSVSRTFTKGAPVSASTRRKVEQAAKALGYSPNVLASSLTTGRTRLIGLVSNNFHNPYFLQVFDLFTRGLQDRGLRPLLVNLSEETDPANSVRMLVQYSVDGVVLASSNLPNEFSMAFRNAGVPVVHTFGRCTGSRQVHLVGIDNLACGRLAADTLVSRGYRRIAFLGGARSATTTRDRHRGFMQALANHPQIEVSCSFADNYSYDAGYREMLRLLEQRPAEAYFCGDDVLSIGALSALQARNFSVPEDVGLLGVNDMDMANWAIVNLTTIRQPVRDIIDSSIELMVRTLDEPDRAPESRVLPCSIVERGSLRPLRAT